MIKNKEELVKNGESNADRDGRRIILESLDYVLEKIDPYQLIKSKIDFDGKILSIKDLSFDLNKYERIFVIGGGKATGSMAKAVEEILVNRISYGIVNILEHTSEDYRTNIIKLNEVSHPIPNDNGIEGVEKMLEVARDANENDLVICLISGGGSAMMPLPANGVNLSEKQEITKNLLHSGATINEMNSVRKHLSKFKGGMLAKAVYPTKLVSLILSDVVNDPLDVIASGPTVPDNSYFEDAVSVLKKYNLWNSISDSIRKRFEVGMANKTPETPKPQDKIFQNVDNIVIGNNRVACNAAMQKLNELNVESLFLTSCLEGEAKYAGLFYSALALEKIVNRESIAKPFAMILGGETTVTVSGKGQGGRNQEAILSALTKIKGLNGVSIASLGTDGIDGPTDAAGVIIDGKSAIEAEKKNLLPLEYLSNNDSYNFFRKINELIFTGPTGSNVNDITIIIIMPIK